MKIQFSVQSDREGNIQETSGDVTALFGRPNDVICAQSLTALFAKESRESVLAALKDASKYCDSFLDNQVLLTNDGRFPKVDIAIQPESETCLTLRFSRANGKPKVPPPLPPNRYFSLLAQMHAEHEPADVQVLMLDFGSVFKQDLNNILKDENGNKKLRFVIERTLAADADNDQIGKLGPDSYSLLRNVDPADDPIFDKLRAAITKAGLQDDSLQLPSHSVVLDVEGIDETMVRRALSCARMNFLKSVRTGAFSGSTQLGGLIKDVEQVVEQIETAIRTGALQVDFQTVMDLASGGVAYRIAYGKVIVDGVPTALSDLIVLEDFPDLCQCFDKEAAKQAMAQVPLGDRSTPMFVSIAPSTLQSGAAENIAKSAGYATNKFGFRIQGLDISNSASKTMQRVQDLIFGGFPVLLTEFTRMLYSGTVVDSVFVEVSSSLLRKFGQTKDGRSLLNSLMKVWRRADIEVVVTELDSESSIDFVTSLGVSYGMGAAVEDIVHLQ